ncbi:MAG: aminotransferase class III-fold pyridoxal phosphate-dependent enzyme, partial [Alistipes sp.]|nr:aminotransferase class III-fold pyridoxal phosphate-dependent enzyme [Alistipes sp.]
MANEILRKAFLAHVGQTSPSPMMIEVERAEGVFFYTPEGKPYYDLVAGVSVSNVGHANPAVVKAVQEQAAKYMHVMVYGEMVERPQVEYATRIASLLPGDIDSVYFLSTGAEAVEGALKLTKRYTARREIISMRRAYHGSTHGAMTLMGSPEGEEWKGAFRPLMPDVRSIEFNDFGQLAEITERTACVIAEPVQGEAGVRPPQ